MLRELLLTTSDYEAWQKYLPASRSVFGSVGYARACEEFRKSSPRLYVVASDKASICYPLLLRSTQDLPFQATTSARWDSTTPDFTGPLLVEADTRIVGCFPSLCAALFRSEGIVAEFAHLYPWTSMRAVLDQNACFYNNDIIWVDLTSSVDELWRNQLQHCCRKNITRSVQEGVRVFSGSSDELIREFLRIYSDTMRSRQALTRYYFSYGFFCALRDELPENSRFVFAEYRNQIIAATLYLHDNMDVFSFLGGADNSFQMVRPTNAVIWDTIQWARDAGKKRLILGGGYKPDDGIFRFKATFSRLRQAFYIYRRVHLEQDYALLERQCLEHYRVGKLAAAYFPSYRQTPHQA
jgi:hypothetical protein